MFIAKMMTFVDCLPEVGFLHDKSTAAQRNSKTLVFATDHKLLMFDCFDFLYCSLEYF